VFTALLALSYYVETGRVTLDYYLERRISWWWKIAELRQPAPDESTSPPAEGGRKFGDVGLGFVKSNITDNSAASVRHHRQRPSGVRDDRASDGPSHHAHSLITS
jgi:hypothetical protein